MSWRLIFVFLLLTASAATWGGLQLGDWLIAHGPAQVQSPAPISDTSLTPVLDANGKPFVATAPQPLPNGSQGVPEIPPPVDWSIPAASLMAEPPRISLATTTITLDEAIALASQNQMDSLQGIGTIGALGTDQSVLPIDITPPPATASASGNNNWQAAFQAELQACENVGFFSRPSCAWAARNKYCEPHQAWGRVPGCPSKKPGY